MIKTKKALNSKETSKTKNPVGRPTKYKPEFCDAVIDCMRKGASKHEIALELDIHYDTIYEWEKEHKEFSDALKKGLCLSESWWIRQGRINLDSKSFQTVLWYMNMKNRHGWSDKKSIFQPRKIPGFAKASLPEQIAIIDKLLDNAKISCDEYQVFISAIKIKIEILNAVELSEKVSVMWEEREQNVS